MREGLGESVRAETDDLWAARAEGAFLAKENSEHTGLCGRRVLHTLNR